MAKYPWRIRTQLKNSRFGLSLSRQKYIDRVAANYMPQDDKVGQILMYHTQVYNVQRTKGLKNATNRKWEAGFDIKLSDKHKLSLIGYHDKTANGFGSATEYFTYTANYYSAEKD